MRTITSPSALRLALSALLLACTPGVVRPDEPDFVADKQALSFEACPAVIDGEPIPGVAPDVETVTIENLGKAAGTVSLRITGPGASSFSIVEATRVNSLAPRATAPIAIRFSPAEAGTVTAVLEVDDGIDASALLEITLSGVGSALSPRPYVEIQHQAKETAEWIRCTEGLGGVIDNCSAEWPLLFIGDALTRSIKLRNLGCAPMNVTGISIDRGTAPLVQFQLESPVIPPTPAAPLVVPGSHGELELRVVFRPMLPEELSVVNVLGITTDAANGPQSAVSLIGNAEVPMSWVDPSYCDLTHPDYTCATDIGGGKRLFTFEIHNGGQTPITVDSIRVRQPHSGRFAIGPRDPTGAVIPAAAFVEADVTYTDAPLYVTDTIDVVTVVGPKVVGKPTVTVSGGVLPHLKVSPDPVLDFSSRTAQTSRLPLEICNVPTTVPAGDLVIHGLTLDQYLPTSGSGFFALIDPPAAGTVLTSGNCLSFDVQFSRPVSGGQQYGTLVIATNDPDFAPDSHKKITLFSQTGLDYIPVADCRGPNGEGPFFSYDLSTLTPKRIKICGNHSYDPPLTQNDPPPRGIEKWKFTLYEAPDNVAPGAVKLTQLHTNGSGQDVSSQMLTDLDCDGVAGNGCCVDLNVDAQAVGLYKIACLAYDFSGQKSGNTAELKINMW